MTSAAVDFLLPEGSDIGPDKDNFVIFVPEDIHVLWVLTGAALASQFQ